MTYLAGLTFEQKLGGLVLLSGRLPLQEQFKSVRLDFMGRCSGTEQLVG